MYALSFSTKTQAVVLGLISLGVVHATEVEAARPDKNCTEYMLTKQMPRYPSAARKAGKQGRVEIGYSLDGTGKAVEIQIAKSSDSKSLDDASVRTLKEIQFEPGVHKKNCVFEVEFHLGK